MKGEAQQGHKQFQVLKVNRYEIQENAVFLDYDLNTLLKQIQNFSDIKVYTRQSMSKNLKSIEEVLASKPQQFCTLLQKMSHDHQDIQNELLAYFGSKVEQSKLTPNYKKQMQQPLINLAKGPYLEIKEEACNLLSKMSHKLAPQQKKQIITFAKQISQSDNEENKIAAIQLLAKLAPQMDEQQRKKMFSELFMEMYNSASVRVKKQIIIQTGTLAKNLKKEFVQSKIIKDFLIKETQQTAWGIRKACVQILTILLQNVDSCKMQLSDLLLNLLKDGNKFVRIAAYKAVPQFLAKYGNQAIPQKLFQIYLTMIDLDINNQVSKLNELIINVAYYFPGVLQTAGAHRWPQMQKLFNRLIHFRNQQVKLPLASSLHDISSIIGPQRSKQYLFSALDYLLKEQSDSLKLNAIRNLSKFVQQFEKVTRQNLIDVFLVLQKDPKKWRVRLSIAQQLKYLSQLYDAETIFKYILPISLKLCNDNVSQVRHEAAIQMINIINHLKKDQGLYMMSLESIKGHALSQKYIQRQTFCLMLETLFENQQSFIKNFDQVIQPLVQDPIPIVRIALAISLKQIIKDYHCKSEKMSYMINKLKQDSEAAQFLE